MVKSKGYNTDVYSESEIKRIAKVAFEIAGCAVAKYARLIKFNVLEVTGIVEANCNLQQKHNIQISSCHICMWTMQRYNLVRAPKQFDVIVTGNLFGDILSDVKQQC